MTVTLYETNSDILVIAKDGQAWSLGTPSGDYLNGTFAADAKAWTDGDWEPNENDGQTPTTLSDDIPPVAEWTADGVRLLVRRDQLGGAANTYLGKTDPASITVTLDRSSEDDGWDWADAALEQWTKAAEKTGLAVEVVSYEVPDVDHDTAIVAVDGTRYVITVRNDEITAQLGLAYTLTLIEGDAGRDANGTEINEDESPISYSQLDDATTTWLAENGYDPEHPDRWVLVTPAGEDPGAVNAVASRSVTV
ncbi:hypothetical protein [Sphaerimonospora thailandensis]|uniref:Uncharacterized protein n=1 Tax=Sphaerimonospora thailandensis TaxID=795644 RepID=A0A8J3R973_9ACTN|nr:hypothetical protein [Sphaerimonospora thailandensis]GIH70364.1 hypothetical protein Mth01_26170 [Sphaerimonospora thailandensis]